ncbi:MAG TPA: hypothetical protein VNL14_21500 [Candidatus Acidoferrales bacterium]|nr:hypothetical protein [Candidatus Acidoferrales bacterium]
MIGTWLNQLALCVRDRLALRWGVSVGVAFVLLYLYSVGNIVIAPGAGLAFGIPLPSASVVPDWAEKISKPIAPFVWEPVAALYLSRSVAVFISVPNLVLAVFFGTLVALNMAVAIARTRVMATATRGRGVVSGFLASFPALLTGVSCCVPTVILALGSLAAALSVAAITIAPYFVPVAAGALAANLLWSLRQFACAVPWLPESQVESQSRLN